MPLAEEAVEDIIPEPQVSAIERKWIEKMKQRQDLITADIKERDKVSAEGSIARKKHRSKKIAKEGCE